MQDHAKLLVWQRARSLTVLISEASRSFRTGDAPGLRSQLMRATMSISATIAEGAGRASRADFARFISMAIASASEVENHLQTARDLGVVSDSAHTKCVDRCVEVRRMLFGLHKALLRADAAERDAGGAKANASRRSTRDSNTG